jgi:hypothetical protein
MDLQLVYSYHRDTLCNWLYMGLILSHLSFQILTNTYLMLPLPHYSINSVSNYFQLLIYALILLSYSQTYFWNLSKVQEFLWFSIASPHLLNNKPVNISCHRENDILTFHCYWLLILEVFYKVKNLCNYISWFSLLNHHHRK